MLEHAFPLLRRAVGGTLALLLASHASADPVTTSTLGWAVNGTVSEVVRAGDVAYVGGSFGTVAPSPNLVFGFATFATDSAVPVLPRLAVNNRVRAVVALRGGGWLIGGAFTSVNGTSRHRLARLLPDGTLDTSCSLAADGAVWAMTVTGGKVYLGSSFTMLGSSNRQRLAALDATTLALDTTFVPTVSGGSSPSVCALVVGGGTVYVGGSFPQVNGVSQANLGAVDATNGALLLTFTGTTDGRVNALALDAYALFAAGEFNSVGGVSRRGVARLSPITGAADTAFDANGNGVVSGLALAGSTHDVAGSFGQMGGQDREHLAALTADTGTAYLPPRPWSWLAAPRCLPGRSLPWRAA